MNYVIVGNGIAGLSAAEEIRKNDMEGKIILIGREEYLTYNRVKLSHFISKEDYSMDELLVYDENWYKERKIEVLLNTKVISINSKDKEVITDNKGKITYDKLLIANGSSPFVPPITGVDKKGVFVLRTINDLTQIQRYVKKCSTISVIGGGLLGLEAAWSLHKLGKKVNIIEFSPYLLPRQLDKELGIYLQEQLEKEGLNFYFDAVAQEILGDKIVSGIKLKDKRIVDSDLVLISTGVRSNLKITEGTNINVERGIVVDNHMETNIESIYAAGDIAQYNDLVLALWSVAMDQGKVAGANMCGNKKEYNMPKPAATLLIGNIKMFSVGNVNNTEKDIKIQGENYFHKLFLDSGKLIGGILIGDIKKMIALKKAVNENRDISNMLNKDITPQEILNSL
ncbi:NAD(P)/FAD-dependent oxidoreductase [Paramaledivibacter caminithermalis]|uniref:Nitrite reductase (NADH) large subunit n=1 Tax=Paramaledivibacter caminithermalis (strain DSM 15212 / CIP 107654 / DViRD3) TaxID=1121301 RepID=A0A1M6NCW1_PARC5|nr:FAD-dependent oxidoreductase [Paramaledivibacter caminithermalis]SHJ93444.1 nitrite reductase (NADH) large subunit [Paramaledivibacter caminithermalis DSM 15212]